MKTLSTKIRCLFAVLIAVMLSACAVGFAACSGDDSWTKTTTDLSVGLNYYSKTLEPGGDSFALKAVVSGTHTGGYEWSTSSNVVTLAPADDICVVTTGAAEGYAKVTLTVDNLSASCDVYVAEKVVAESITFSQESQESLESLDLTVGDESEVEVTVNMSDTTTSADFSFTVSEGDIVTVTRTGSKLTIKANAEGEAKITVTADDVTESITVKVTAATTATPELKSVTLDPETLALDLSGTSSGTVTAAIADADYAYTWTGDEWSSDNENVATVTATENTATVTAVGTGEAKITVELSGTVSASCEITVTDGTSGGQEPALTGVTLDPTSLALDVYSNLTGTVTATVLDEGYTYTWTGNEWSSDNENVATVTANGNIATVTAVSDGSATITVKLSETVSASCQVTVSDSTPAAPELTGVTLDPTALTLDLNGTTSGTITATIADAGYVYTWTGSEWSSSNTDVAAVSASGNAATVTAVGTGTATITVKLSETVSASCEITVTNGSQGSTEPALTGVTLNPTSLALDVYSNPTGTITATILDGGYEYNWTGSEWTITGDASVVQISASGATLTITAIAAGTTQITVTLAEGISATCNVTVTDSTPAAQLVVESVALDPADSVELTPGDTTGVTVTATVALGTDSRELTVDDYNWTYDGDNAVTMTVSDDGKSVTLVATDGATAGGTLKLQVGDKETTCTVTIASGSSEPETPEHTHTLTKIDATKATCTEPGNSEYWECSDCGKIFSDGSGETETTVEEVTIPAIGHSWKINEESWTWDFTNGGPDVSVTFDCENGCGSSSTVNATVTGEDGTYTATVTGPDGKEYTDTYMVSSDVIEIEIDISRWPNDYSDKIAMDDSGIVTYIDGLNGTWYYSDPGYLGTSEEDPDNAAESTKGYTNKNTNGYLNDYLIIDLTQYNAESVTLTMDCYTNANTKKGVLALVTGVEGQNDVFGTDQISVTDGNTLLSSVSVNGNRQTLELTADVSGLDYVYLEFNAPLRIYGMTLTITLGDGEGSAPEGEETIVCVDFGSEVYGAAWSAFTDDDERLVLYTDNDGNAILTYVESDGDKGEWDSSSGYVSTCYDDDGSACTAGNNNYFVIDVSGATSVTIEIVFTSQGKEGNLYITTEQETCKSSGQAVKPSSSIGEESTNGANKVTGTFTIDVSGYEALYIEYDVGLNIYSINITIS